MYVSLTKLDDFFENVGQYLHGIFKLPCKNKFKFFFINFLIFPPNFCQLFRAFKFDILILILYLYYFSTKRRGRTKSLNAPKMWKLCSALKRCIWITFEWVCCHGFGPTWIFFLKCKSTLAWHFILAVDKQICFFFKSMFLIFFQISVSCLELSNLIFLF